jgi:hypothetical protein
MVSNNAPSYGTLTTSKYHMFSLLLLTMCSSYLRANSYGKEAPLTITRGKIHEYLGMTIDYSIKGKVQFTMIPYIKDMLSEAPNDMAGESATPAASHLFQVNEDAAKLDEETA